MLKLQTTNCPCTVFSGPSPPVCFRILSGAVLKRCSKVVMMVVMVVVVVKGTSDLL